MNSTVYRWSNCYLKETDHLNSGAGTYLDRVGVAHGKRRHQSIQRSAEAGACL